MTTREALELGLALLFPLGLLTLLLGTVAAARGRTRGEIVRGLLAIVACLAGVVSIGLALSVSRGGALIDYEAGSLGVGMFGYLDAAGIVACVGLLGVALIVATGLTATRGTSSAGETES